MQQHYFDRVNSAKPSAYYEPASGQRCPGCQGVKDEQRNKVGFAGRSTMSSRDRNDVSSFHNRVQIVK